MVTKGLHPLLEGLVIRGARREWGEGNDALNSLSPSSRMPAAPEQLADRATVSQSHSGCLRCDRTTGDEAKVGPRHSISSQI